MNKNKSNTDFDIYISVVCFYKEWELDKTEPNSCWSFYTFLAAKRIGEIFNQKEKERETPTEKLTEEPSLECRSKNKTLNFDQLLSKWKGKIWNSTNWSVASTTTAQERNQA